MPLGKQEDRTGAKDLTIKTKPDCCDKCVRLDCYDIPRRCWPNGEIIEQCTTCQSCPMFMVAPPLNPAEFHTAKEIMEAGK